ncbi:hypothetical protein [Arabiibacter massiliensis]|uniref:hypothetical protein n=1 Tax=Arabiibacter massiliensis TaxID=1870985 RepID=UPI0009BB4CA8|nr:hypothetical protein [Arabiibacter massiliensis]
MVKSAPLSNEEARDLLRSLGIPELPKARKGRDEREGGDEEHDESITALLKELSRSDLGRRPPRGNLNRWP